MGIRPNDEARQGYDTNPSQIDPEKIKIEYDKLVLSTFRSPAGKELLNVWDKTFVNGDIFADTTRETDYNLGQRDFVVEIKAILNGE